MLTLPTSAFKHIQYSVVSSACIYNVIEDNLDNQPERRYTLVQYYDCINKLTNRLI